MNEELGTPARKSCTSFSQRYAETLRSMPLAGSAGGQRRDDPVVERRCSARIWRSRLRDRSVGVGIDSLPLQSEVRAALIRRYRSVLQKAKGSILHTESLNSRHELGDFDVALHSVFNNDRESGRGTHHVRAWN